MVRNIHITLTFFEKVCSSHVFIFPTQYVGFLHSLLTSWLGQKSWQTMKYINLGWYKVQKDLGLVLGIPSTRYCIIRFFGPTSSFYTAIWMTLGPAVATV